MLVLYVSGRKVRKKLLIPIMLGGLAGIYVSWIPFVVDFYMPFYGPDPPTDGQYALAFMALPPILMIFVVEGMLPGSVVSIGITLISDITGGRGELYIAPRNRKWFLMSVVLLIGTLIFLFIPWNYRSLYYRTYRDDLKAGNISQEKFMKVFQKSIRTKNKDLLYFFAGSERSSESALWQIFEFSVDHKKSSLMSSLLDNPKTPDEMYYKVYEYCLPYMEEEPDYPGGFIRFMLTYEKDFSAVLEDMARSLNSPAELLEKLAESPRTDIRKNVAKNTSTPIKILEELSEDREYTVRQSLCYNDSTSTALILKLQTDPNSNVKRAAEYRLKKLGYPVE